MPTINQLIFSKDTRWALLVFGVALAARAVFLVQFSSSLLFANHIMDMAYHHDWAIAIAAGSSFIDGPFFRAPFYPHFLGLCYWLFGDGPWAARIIQALMGSLSCALAFRLGLFLFSRRVGLIAGLGLALYGPAIWFDGQLLVTTLTVLLNLLALVGLTRSREHNSLPSLALGGLALGLSAITRPTILLFAVVAVFWIWRWQSRLDRPRVVRSLLAYAAAFLFPIIPVTVYNYTQSGEFTLIGTYGGMNAYIGNNPESDGVSARLPGARGDWWGMMEDAERMAESDLGRELSPAQVSGYWYGRTLDQITAAPGRFVTHLGRKALLLMWGEELSNNVDLYFFAGQETITKLLMWSDGPRIPWGLVMPLAVLGMIVTWPKRRRHALLLWYLAASTLPLLLFFVTARYRLPLVPIMLVFCAAGLAGVRGWWRQTSNPIRVGTIAAVVLAVVVTNVNLMDYRTGSGAQGYHATATLFAERGELVQAERYYRLALTQDPGLPEAINDLSQVVAAQGRLDEAERLLSQALVDFPDNYILRYNYGTLLNALGRCRDATQHLKAAVTVRPDYIDAWNNLGFTYSQLGLSDSAIAAFEALMKLDPDFVDAYYNCGIEWYHAGRLDTAAALFERATQLTPPKTEAFYYLGLIGREQGHHDEAIRNFEKFLLGWRGDPSLSEQAQTYIRELREP
ncbi:MAG: tetratricopeptide repeat protein [bacterium]